jgi:hypothetical protein
MHEAKKCGQVVRMIGPGVVVLSVGRIAAWLLAGLLVGGTIRKLLCGGRGGITDAVLGIFGGLLGGVAYVLILGGLAISWVSILTAVGGALVLVGIRGGVTPPL